MPLTEDQKALLREKFPRLFPDRSEEAPGEAQGSVPTVTEDQEPARSAPSGPPAAAPAGLAPIQGPEPSVSPSAQPGANQGLPRSEVPIPAHLPHPFVRGEWPTCRSCGAPSQPEELGGLCLTCREDFEETKAQLANQKQRGEIKWI